MITINDVLLNKEMRMSFFQMASKDQCINLITNERSKAASTTVFWFETHT